MGSWLVIAYIDVYYSIRDVGVIIKKWIKFLYYPILRYISEFEFLWCKIIGFSYNIYIFILNSSSSCIYMKECRLLTGLKDSCICLLGKGHGGGGYSFYSDIY